MALVAPLPFWPANAERSERAIGTLHVRSGRLVACDPLVMERAPVAFARTIPAGTYEVRSGVGDGDRAYVVLVVGAGVLATWEHARREGEGVHPVVRKAPGFDVDATTGAYLDRDAAQHLFRDRAGSVTLFERLRAAGYDKHPWATLTLAPGLDMVAFGTGGDGNFPSFWGLDAQGEPMALVTDLGVLRDRDEDEDEDDEPSGPLAVVIPFPKRPR